MSDLILPPTPGSQDAIRRAVLGASYARASRFLRRYNLIIRIVSIDDVLFFGTADYRPNRINLKLETRCNFSETDPSEALDYVRRKPHCVRVVGATFG